MEYLRLGAHQKNLTFALSSWETLDLFDYEVVNTDRVFAYDPETRVITLRQRGWYRIEFMSQLLADDEQMIFLKYRLSIDGTPETLEFQKNTGEDQTWMRVVMVETTSEIIIEVNATPNDGSPTISNSGMDFLLITKFI